MDRGLDVYGGILFSGKRACWWRVGFWRIISIVLLLEGIIDCDAQFALILVPLHFRLFPSIEYHTS